MIRAQCYANSPQAQPAAELLDEPLPWLTNLEQFSFLPFTAWGDLWYNALTPEG